MTKKMYNIISVIKNRVLLLYRQQLSLLLYSLSGKHSISRNRISDLHNIHKGKRAFIVCNGPSLRADDLTKIYKNKDISFASNKIQGVFSKTAWRPTYYCVFDEGYQYSLLDVMNEIPAEMKFFRDKSFIVTRNIKSPTIWLKTDGRRKLLENPQFSDNIGNCVYTIATVTYTMLQIAVHMGIREIYIIGCDNSYGIERTKDGAIIDRGKASYFKGSGMEKNSSVIAATWEMNIAYEYAAKYASEHGINIINATRGGYLEAFPRADFDSLF